MADRYFSYVRGIRGDEKQCKHETPHIEYILGMAPVQATIIATQIVRAYLMTGQPKVAVELSTNLALNSKDNNVVDAIR